MPLSGLKISVGLLDRVLKGADVSPRSGGVTAATLEATLAANPTCRCEDEQHMNDLSPHVRGHLYAGMPVAELRELAGGCTSGVSWSVGYVCTRLDLIRRRHGV